jgi:hypothetical protein
MRLLTTFIILLATSSCTRGQAGLRIKITAHSEVSGMPGMKMADERSTVIYAEHGRIRVESPTFRHFPPTVMIERCDSRLMYALDSANREYTESPIATPQSSIPASEKTEQKSNERLT